MKPPLWIVIVALLANTGCVPLIVGSAAAVAADTVAEQDGDDGLF
ncbi:MAG: hypothetical protein AAGE76_14825 [Pseudomonadota bacterium]